LSKEMPNSPISIILPESVSILLFFLIWVYTCPSIHGAVWQSGEELCTIRPWTLYPSRQIMDGIKPNLPEEARGIATSVHIANVFYVASRIWNVGRSIWSWDGL
jgi:hypothetical protein